MEASTGIGGEAAVGASGEASTGTERGDGHRHGRSHTLSGSGTTITYIALHNRSRLRCKLLIVAAIPIWLAYAPVAFPPYPVQESPVTDRDRVAEAVSNDYSYRG